MLRPLLHALRGRKRYFWALIGRFWRKIPLFRSLKCSESLLFVLKWKGNFETWCLRLVGVILRTKQGCFTVDYHIKISKCWDFGWPKVTSPFKPLILHQFLAHNFQGSSLWGAVTFFWLDESFFGQKNKWGYRCLAFQWATQIHHPMSASFCLGLIFFDIKKKHNLIRWTSSFNDFLENFEFFDFWSNFCQEKYWEGMGVN